MMQEEAKTSAPLVESGLQLLSRINQPLYTLKDINSKLFQKGEPSPNQTIEIAGDFGNDLLLDFLIRCILPPNLNQEWKASGVVLINTNNHLNILRITTLIDAHLKSMNIKLRKAIIEKALTFLTILNCYDEEQLEITLLNLETIIEERENVSLLIVDDIASQFCVYKQNSDQSFEHYCRTNFDLLQRIVRHLNLVLIFSRYQLADNKKTTSLPVDFKIVTGYTNENKAQCSVTDCAHNTTKEVTCNVETFISFT